MEKQNWSDKDPQDVEEAVERFMNESAAEDQAERDEEAANED